MTPTSRPPKTDHGAASRWAGIFLILALAACGEKPGSNPEGPSSAPPAGPFTIVRDADSGDVVPSLEVELVVLEGARHLGRTSGAPSSRFAKNFMKVASEATTDARGMAALQLPTIEADDRAFLFAERVSEDGSRVAELFVELATEDSGLVVLPGAVRLGDPSAGVVEGRVLVRGGPLAGAEVLVRLGGFHPRGMRRIKTNAEGHFRWEGLSLPEITEEMNVVAVSPDRFQIMRLCQAQFADFDVHAIPADFHTPINHRYRPGCRIEQDFGL